MKKSFCNLSKHILSFYSFIRFDVSNDIQRIENAQKHMYVNAECMNLSCLVTTFFSCSSIKCQSFFSSSFHKKALVKGHKYPIDIQIIQ